MLNIRFLYFVAFAGSCVYASSSSAFSLAGSCVSAILIPSVKSAGFYVTAASTTTVESAGSFISAASTVPVYPLLPLFHLLDHVYLLLPLFLYIRCFHCSCISAFFHCSISWIMYIRCFHCSCISSSFTVPSAGSRISAASTVSSHGSCISEASTVPVYPLLALLRQLVPVYPFHPNCTQDSVYPCGIFITVIACESHLSSNLIFPLCLSLLVLPRFHTAPFSALTYIPDIKHHFKGTVPAKNYQMKKKMFCF